MFNVNEILVTGGAGYIGSHAVVELIEQGFRPILLDNFSNSSDEVLNRIESITNVKPMCYDVDIRDYESLKQIFDKHSFDAVIHFAGLKAVGESVKQPIEYYQNNVQGSLVLFQVMQECECLKLVFSSSATVYGDPDQVPIDESSELKATNPYGQSKLMIENILRDIHVANPTWQISILRYFNPVAAHKSGLIGDSPNGVPNNLMPYVAQVSVGKLSHLVIFGDDYPTGDGTGVRDYIHVVDLAKAHLSALNALCPSHGCRAYNVGTGQGYSVLEVVKAYEKASGQKIPYVIEARRAGDIAECYAKTVLCQEHLSWRAEYTLEEMMADHWRWQINNPNGYKSS